MQRAVAFVCAFCLVRSFAASRDDHPIAKVISLLKELKAKAQQESKAEEATYIKFDSWCKESLRTMHEAVATDKENIDTLESKVAAKTEEEKSLKSQIARLEKELGKNEASAAEAEEERRKASELYSASDADLDATVTAIGDAITALGDAKTSTEGLLQKVAKMPLVRQQLSEQQVRTLEAPKVTKEDILKVGSQAKHEKKYQFKSGNVVELLKELKNTFEDERVERTKAETAAANAFNLQKDARAAAVLAAETAKGEKTTLLGETQGDLEEAKTSLQGARDDLEADAETLKTTKTTCDTKKTEWKERYALRQRELKAMDAAVEILAKVSGVRSEQPENPVPPPSPLEAAESFLQVGSSDPKARALQLLRAEATRAKSQTFDRFTEELAAHLGGPFDEVGGMIQKMIFRLMAEQKDEDDHKNWCDLEITKTNTSIKSKEEKVDSLTLKIEEGKATVQTLADEITDATEASTTIDAHLKELGEVRKEGKAENKAAIKDADDAQKALANAIAVLEAYYKDSGAIEKQAWEFLQQPAELPESPESWSSSYTGVADPKSQPGGIVSVLEECATDFAKMEADTRAAEETDQDKYNEEAKRCKIEKARRDKEAEMKTDESTRLKDKIGSYEKSLKHTNNELGATEQYMKDLAPACIEGDSTYEDRKQARADEIAALKEAQVILAEAFREDKEGEERTEASSFLAPAKRIAVAK